MDEAEGDEAGGDEADGAEASDWWDEQALPTSKIVARNPQALHSRQAHMRLSCFHLRAGKVCGWLHNGARRVSSAL